MAVPKVIFAYWHSGERSAPPLVRMCLDRWRRLNPDFELRVLTAEDADAALRGMRMCFSTMSVQAFTDVLRTRLLQDGGVWIDATVFPVRPLTGWLDEIGDDRTILLRSPGGYRSISSWFIVAETGSPLMERLWSAVARYWRPRGRLCRPFERPSLASGRRTVPTRIARGLLRNLGPHRMPKPDAYFSISDDMAADDPGILDIVTDGAEGRWSGVYPYFWFHMIVSAVVTQDAAIEAYWQGCPEYDAGRAHAVQNRLIEDPDAPLEDLVRLAGQSPVQKLKWQAEFPWRRCLELDQAL